jgi:hypothetical protein
MQKLYILFFLFIISSCQSNTERKKEIKSNSEKIEVTSKLNMNGLIIDKQILSQIEKELSQKSTPLNREVWKFDRKGGEENYTLDTGIIFKSVKENIAHAIFNKYHNEILEGGNYLFFTNLDFDEKRNTYYDIVIINQSDQFKIVELIGTHGINYDLFNQDILQKLKEWHQEVNFKIQIIDEDRIHAYLLKEPKDYSKFTAEIYEFCPDVIDQGYGSMKEMITDYRTNRYFWLWFD